MYLKQNKQLQDVCLKLNHQSRHFFDKAQNSKLSKNSVYQAQLAPHGSEFNNMNRLSQYFYPVYLMVGMATNKRL